MSVGLLFVRLWYRFYVFGHLSKWFTFFFFLVVCLLLSGRHLYLLPTVTYKRSAGLEALHFRFTTMFVNIQFVYF